VIVFIGMTAVSHYFESIESNPDLSNSSLNTEILALYHKPLTTGEWFGLARNIFKKMSIQKCRLPEFKNLFEKKFDDPLGLEKKEQFGFEEIFNTLNSFRKSIAHEKAEEITLDAFEQFMNFIDNGKDQMEIFEEQYKKIEIHLIRFLKSLFFLKDYRFLTITSDEDNVNNLNNYFAAVYQGTGTSFRVESVCSAEILKKNKMYLAKIQEKEGVLIISENNFAILNPMFFSEKYNGLPAILRFEEFTNDKKEIMNSVLWVTEALRLTNKNDKIDETIRILFIEWYQKLRNNCKLSSAELAQKEELCRKLNIEFSRSCHKRITEGRYRNLTISSALLANIRDNNSNNLQKELTAENNEIMKTMVEKSDKEIDINSALKTLWQDGIRKVQLIGNGGMGKTVSLLQIWKDYLNDSGNKTIPIYISLNDYNSASEMELKNNYLINKIGKEYLQKPNLLAAEINFMWDLFNNGIESNNLKFPSVLLMLDGYNEITIDKTAIDKSIREISECLGVQLVITSRYELKNYFVYQDSVILNMLPLNDERIKTYIESKNQNMQEKILMPEDDNLRQIIRNPMMLCIYCESEKIIRQNGDNTFWRLIRKPEKTAELIFNFFGIWADRMNSSAANIEERLIYSLLFNHLIPYIGYEMEKNGAFFFENKELRKIINDRILYYQSEEFLECNDEYYELEFFFNDNSAGHLPGSNVQKIIRMLCENLRILVKEHSQYRFLHQHFRDFFAAKYIIDQSENRINNGDNSFPELNGRIIDIHLRKMLGELAGEHRRMPYLKNGYQKGKLKETVFDRALAKLRNLEMTEDDYRIHNILQILKEQRIDLSDTNLSYLDLRRIMFNNVRLGHGEINDKNYAVTLSGSKIKCKNFFSQGHNIRINYLSYSSDGKYILSVDNENIREWNSIGECINVYSLSSDFTFVTAVFSPDNSRILTTSYEFTNEGRNFYIHEWNRNNSKIINTYNIISLVENIIYNDDSYKIYFLITGHISQSTIDEVVSDTLNEKHTYKLGYNELRQKLLNTKKKYNGSLLFEIDIRTNICIQIFDTDAIKYYDDCKLIFNEFIVYLSHTENTEILKINLKTKMTESIKFHISGGLLLSQELYIVKSDDNVFLIYNSKFNNSTIFSEKNNPLKFCAISKDNKSILFACEDYSIIEFDISSGLKKRIIQSSNHFIYEAAGNSKYKKIVTINEDGTISEWNIFNKSRQKTIYLKVIKFIYCIKIRVIFRNGICCQVN